MTGHTLGLEYLSASGRHAWHPIPGAVTITVRPNPIERRRLPDRRRDHRRHGRPARRPRLVGLRGRRAPDRRGRRLPARPDQGERGSQHLDLHDEPGHGPGPTPVPLRRRLRRPAPRARRRMPRTSRSRSSRRPATPASSTPRRRPPWPTLTPGASVAVSLTSHGARHRPRGPPTNSTPRTSLAFRSFDGTLLVGDRVRSRDRRRSGRSSRRRTSRPRPVICRSSGSTRPARPRSRRARRAQYGLALRNTGSAEARAIVVSDAITGVGARPVSGAPTTLAPNATASASASYPVPAGATQSIVNTGTVRWTDAAGNGLRPRQRSAHDHRHRAAQARRHQDRRHDGRLRDGRDDQLRDRRHQPRRPAGQRRRRRTTRRTRSRRSCVGSVTTTAGSVGTGNTAGDTTVSVSLGTVAGRTTQVVAFDATVGFVPDGVVVRLEPGDRHERRAAGDPVGRPRPARRHRSDDHARSVRPPAAAVAVAAGRPGRRSARRPPPTARS